MKKHYVFSILASILSLLLLQLVQSQSVVLTVAPGFPENSTYQFVCTPDFFATQYDWSFGDGTQVTTPENSTNHTYLADGDYNVSCTASNETDNVTQTLLVTVSASDSNQTNTSTDSLTLSTAPFYPQGDDAVLVCNATGFFPSGYSWIFGDGSSQSTSQDNVFHTYPQNGTYPAQCDASDTSTSLSAAFSVQIGNGEAIAANQSTNESLNLTNGTTNGTTNTSSSNTSGNGSPDISIADWYPQTGAYVFACNMPGIIPASYSWFFGDNASSTHIQNQNVFHTYLANGHYTVSCTANDAQGNALATAQLAFDINDIPRRNTCSIFQNSPATCSGGNVTQQDFGSSCRLMICDGNGSQIEVLGCDKPSADNPLYFELYNLDANSGSPLQVCVAGTCVGPHAGFARSGLLECTAQVNTTLNTTGNTTTNATINDTNVSGTTDTLLLSLAAGFPQNNTAMLLCTPTGFTPPSIDWAFGDDVNQTTTDTNVTHVYAGQGDYNATCSATDNNTNTTLQSNLTVSILDNTTVISNQTLNATALLTIADGFPQNNTVELVCTPAGFAPTSINWDFGDNVTQLTADTNVTHDYPGPGDYGAVCDAQDVNGTNATGSLTVHINAIV